MKPINIIFFGSTSDSVLILEKLSNVSAVVTQPPKPIGRKQIVTPTPVAAYARAEEIPVTTLDVTAPFKPDLLISACYGEKIPIEAIRSARFGGLNVHPSLLPRWRGGDPVPWAILSGDHQIGVTVVTLAQQFDTGKIIAQKKMALWGHPERSRRIFSDITTPIVRKKLFEIGADLLIQVLPDYLSGKNKGAAQKIGSEPYARRLTREDGFEPWDKLMDPKEEERIDRKFRAFHPWPGLWTLINGKRLKILNFDGKPTVVQWEGKKPIPFTS